MKSRASSGRCAAPAASPRPPRTRPICRRRLCIRDGDIAVGVGQKENALGEVSVRLLAIDRVGQPETGREFKRVARLDHGELAVAIQARFDVGAPSVFTATGS